LTSHVDTRIDAAYVSEHLFRGPRSYKSAECTIQSKHYVDENHPLETFSETLKRLIRESGRSNPDVYRAANVTKQTFSHIINNRDYVPSKSTALAFAVALKLPLEGIKAFLRRAGYSLSDSSEADYIVKEFVTSGNYNVGQINLELYNAGKRQLGQEYLE
jgi:hypothetical protein